MRLSPINLSLPKVFVGSPVNRYFRFLDSRLKHAGMTVYYIYFLDNLMQEGV